ncbi:MAG: exodeoxyribonuclease VII small subunit [Erysipelotrichaceae bacterium]|nr:exodeoxyribonuclease VII small subunit [Erysipelotrichaceae bacterium]
MKELSIEEKFELLEKLVNKLENEKLSLEESIKLYEEAMKLSKELSIELNEVTKKVMLIQENGEKVEF